MGPSGTGKSTLALALAQSLGWRFIEGDSLHPVENLDKMAAGYPLDDADRAPWLARIAVSMREGGGNAVVTCSALRRSYRDQLREAGPALFVLPHVPREELARRLALREGHYMPGSLLDSQLAALELPDQDEFAIILDGCLPLAAQVQRITQALAGQQLP
ncbi:MAG: gluconokinase [Steroidobacteraceae bacterium]